MMNDQGAIRKPAHVAFGLVGFVGGTMLLRLGLALALQRVVWKDEVPYLLLGRNLLSGLGFTTSPDGAPHLVFPPGYPLVVGTIARLVGDLEWASNLAYVLFGGLLLFPVFVIGRRLYGAPTAWLGVLLVAVCPALNVSVLYWGSMTEPLYLCLLYSGLAAVLVGLEDRRWGVLPAAGLLFGLAYLVRPEAFGHAAVSLLVILIWMVRRRLGSLPRAWGAVGGFVAAFALVAAPYVWYIHAHTGRWAMTGKVGLTWELGDAQMRRDWAAVDEILARLWGKPESLDGSLVRNILADPPAFARRVRRNTGALLYETGLYVGGFLPLLALALFRTPWDRRRAAHEAFLVAALMPLLAFLAFHIEVRYFAPALPMLLLWAALGARELGSWLHHTVALCRDRPLAGRGTAALTQWGPAGVLVLVGLLPLAVWAGQARAPLYYKAVGLWLRAHTTADAKVMTWETPITLHADRVRVPVPRTEWLGVLEAARAHGAGYLVVDEAGLRETRPQLAFLIESPPPQLALVHSFAGGGRRRTHVYRFVWPP